MDTYGAAHLGEAYDTGFEFARVGLHEVCQLVDNNDDVRDSIGENVILLSFQNCGAKNIFMI